MKIEKKMDGSLWFRYVSRPIGNIFVRLIYKTNITANQISLFLIFFTLFNFGIIASGRIILGTVLLQIGLILDCMDGTIARLRNNQTKYGKYGKYLELIWHNFIFPLFFIAVGFYSYKKADNIILLILGIFTSMFILSVNLMNYIRLTLKNKSIIKPTKKTLGKMIIRGIACCSYLFTYSLILALFDLIHYITIPYFIFYLILFTIKFFLFLTEEKWMK